MKQFFYRKFNTWRQQQRLLFLLLTLITGIVVLFPYLNFQLHLSPGDHGRDLYSFKKTFEGALLYRDYRSQNGPLMPYYYSLFYRLFGVSVQSTLWGYNLLILLTGILLYGAGTTFLSPGMAYLATLWYWAFCTNEFYYTFNHNGAVFFIIAVVFCLLRYIKAPRRKYVFWAYFCLVGATLVRPDIGLAGYAAFYLSLIMVQRGKNKTGLKQLLRRYLPLPLILLTLTLAIYLWIGLKAPGPALFKDMAYWREIKWDRILQNIFGLKDIFLLTFNHCWPGRSFMLFMALLAIKAFLSRKETSYRIPEDSRLALRALLIFIVFLLMEYLLGMRLFRWRWAYAVSLLFAFGLFEIGISRFRSKKIRAFLICYLLALPMGTAIKNFHFVQSCKVPANHIVIGANDFYVDPYQQENVRTFTRAAEFLRQNTLPDEKILAVPYAPIYYFFSDRDNAFREMNFFSRMPTADELDKKNINYIIVSNRAVRNADTPNESLGKDFGLEFSRYLDEHFDEILTLGDWDQTMGWVIYHGIKIYRRRPGE